ncbi:sensor histidine kinase [Aureibacillus halotolerans]|uniref:histidine kinase n=1 Tax=Aureibacillus halotolerans TaxID=1508390 RepID=A0A4R6TZK6_9BACI|nr:HAMP domain-containing sensor histidine kinase [Aureibacillus halotolerans]TDQ37425.1 HAMP domain-containing protein [Aureibacillus halotolerans]
MKLSIGHPLQYQLLIIIGISAVMSVMTTIGLYFFAVITYSVGILPSFIEGLIMSITELMLIIGAGILTLLLFSIYILLLTRRWFRGLERAISGVEQIARGDFSVQLKTSKNEELSRMQSSINAISGRLEKAIEEERTAVQSKNELVSNVSHDLRTPLTSIIGYLRVIDENRYKDEVELRYYTDIAYQKAHRLNRMVNDLFEFTRVSFGGLRVHKRPLDLGALLGQIGSEYEASLKERGVSVNLQLPEKPIYISADGDTLVRVFENLLSNASKYGSDGKRIDLVLSEESKMAEVAVVNYGEPIPENDLPHLFDRFYRVDKSRTTSNEGSGLGLAISKSILDLHNGHIHVTSTKERTAFIVRLPQLPRSGPIKSS